MRKAELERQLARANRIIGWMAPYIGRMCPPPNGIFEFNEHAFENSDLKLAKPQRDDRPLDQRPDVGQFQQSAKP